MGKPKRIGPKAEALMNAKLRARDSVRNGADALDEAIGELEAKARQNERLGEIVRNAVKDGIMKSLERGDLNGKYRTTRRGNEARRISFGAASR